MRTLCTVMLTATLTGLFAVPAPGQQRRGLPGSVGGVFGGGMLLSNKSVQEELKLTKEQSDKAQEVLQKVQAKEKEAFAKLQDLSPEQQGAKMEELGKAIAADTDRIAAAILTPEQLKRFRQIEWQWRSYQAFADPQMQKTLKLTDDQKDKINTIAQDANRELGELFRGARGGDLQEAGRKMQALRKGAMERINAILTAAQKNTWNEVIGRPFEVKMEFPGRHGGN